MGLHPRSDGAEPGVVDGGDAGNAVCEYIAFKNLAL